MVRLYSTRVRALGESARVSNIRSVASVTCTLPKATVWVPDAKTGSSKRNVKSRSWWAVQVDALEEESNTPTLYGWAATHF